MVWAAALALAIATPAAPGPAILVIHRTNGSDYVPFSNFSRCESARRLFEQRDAETNAKWARQGYPLVEGTQPTYTCIPG